MAKLNFGGTIENVVTREEFPLRKAKAILKNETIAVIGYGVQGLAGQWFQCHYWTTQPVKIL
jgi:hypothetical protein